jgi:hypothetical protein
MGASRPINGREAWGRRSPVHPTGGGSKNISQALPEGLFTNKKSFLFAKRLLTRHPAHPRGGRSPEGHPALPTGGRLPGGASCPPNGRDVPPPNYLSPQPPPNSYIIQQKSRKKERKERKRGEEAAKPCSQVVWRYILVLVV